MVLHDASQPEGLGTASRGLQPGGARVAPPGQRRAEALGYHDEGHLRGLVAKTCITPAINNIRVSLVSVVAVTTTLISQIAPARSVQYRRRRASSDYLLRVYPQERR